MIAERAKRFGRIAPASHVACAAKREPEGLAMRLTAILAVAMWSLGAAFAPAPAAGQTEAKAPYRFGVFPYIPPARIEESYAPAAADFAAALDREVLLRTKTTFADWFEEVRAQRYDIVFIQPFDYVKAFRGYGYLPLARGSEPLAAVLTVLEDSPLTDLSQLRGKSVALPPASAAVSHLTKIALAEAGLEPGRDVTVKHLRNHDSCLQQVVIGAADVCGTARVVVRDFAARRPVAFRVLAETRAIPHVLFAVHSRVSEDDREAIRRVILKWHETEKGRQWLASVGFGPFVPALDADYDIVREFAARLDLPD